jgi:hypothetical protein
MAGLIDDSTKLTLCNLHQFLGRQGDQVRSRGGEVCQALYARKQLTIRGAGEHGAGKYADVKSGLDRLPFQVRQVVVNLTVAEHIFDSLEVA